MNTPYTIGIDYALAAPHVLSIRRDGGETETPARVTATRPAIRAAIESVVGRAAGAPVRIAFEASGKHLHSVLETIEGVELYPINPLASRFHRRALHVSGVKSDPIDADALRSFLENHADELRPSVPMDPASAELGLLCEHRRAIVELRKADANRMIEFVRHDLPALALAFKCYSKTFARLLVAHPDLKALARKRRGTMETWLRKQGRLGAEKREAVLDAIGAIDPTAAGIHWRRAAEEARCTLLRDGQIAAYDKEIEQRYLAHPLHDIIDSLPGAGPALGARLCAFLGADPGRWPRAMDILLRSGIAPVTRKSGKADETVSRRIACRKFDLQSFSEFARASASSCEWAKNFVAAKRGKKQKGKRAKCSAHTAYRSLGYKWIRIIHACIRDGSTYDERKYNTPYANSGNLDNPPVEDTGITCGIPKGIS